MTLEQPPDDGKPDQTEAGLMMFNATNNQTNNQPTLKKPHVKVKVTER